MGITPSTESNTRNNLVPPEKLGDPMADYPEPIKAVRRRNIREIHALFPSTLGESSTETEREKQSEARYCEFMRGGACKEAFTAYEDCAEEAGPRSTKCKELYVKLRNCTHSHHHYYQPYLAVMKSFEEDVVKNMPALVAARKQR